MKRVVFSVLILLCYIQLHAQQTEQIDTIGVKVFFRQGQSILDISYRDNGLRLGAFAERIRLLQQDSLSHVRSIRIVAGASPEGSMATNNRLSENRAAQIRTFLLQRIEPGNLLFEVTSHGIDWEGLISLAEASDMPYRTEVLNTLRYVPDEVIRNGVKVDERKQLLKTMHGGIPWRYMTEHFFPDLRYSEVQLIYAVELFPGPQLTVDSIFVYKTDTIQVPVTQPESAAAQPERKPFYMAVKTNLLYDAILIPNIGVEFYVGQGWSVGADWMYAWWKNDKRHDYWRIYGGELEIRKYFGRRAAEKPLTGHHLSVYLQGLTYDFELGGTGYLSEFSYGAGIEYGYSLPIGYRLNLDFGIGIGYLGGKYKKYKPIDTHYVWQETRQRHWFGPTKAEVSLVWLLGNGNYNVKKGGTR